MSWSITTTTNSKGTETPVIIMDAGDTPTFTLNLTQTDSQGNITPWIPEGDCDIVFAIQDPDDTLTYHYKVLADKNMNIFLPQQATMGLDGKYKFQISVNIYQDGKLSFHNTVIRGMMMITDELYLSREYDPKGEW